MYQLMYYVYSILYVFQYQLLHSSYLSGILNMWDMSLFSWADGPGRFTCWLSSPHCCSEQKQQHISGSTFACYAKTGEKNPSNNVCWRRRAEAITENTFRQIANMRSKVTVESEGSNITAIWLIATMLVTEASHRQRTNSVGEQRGGEATRGKQSISARWGWCQCAGVKNKLHSDQCLLQEPGHLQAHWQKSFKDSDSIIKRWHACLCDGSTATPWFHTCLFGLHQGGNMTLLQTSSARGKGSNINTRRNW